MPYHDDPRSIFAFDGVTELDTLRYLILREEAPVPHRVDGNRTKIAGRSLLELELLSSIGNQGWIDKKSLLYSDECLVLKKHALQHDELRLSSIRLAADRVTYADCIRGKYPVRRNGELLQ